jgi:hypothetical protein
MWSLPKVYNTWKSVMCERQHRATASASDMPSGSGRSSHNGTEGPCALTPTRTAAGQSVGAPNVNSLPLDNSLLRIVAAVQQFMREFSGAVSEEEKIVAITKLSQIS